MQDFRQYDYKISVGKLAELKLAGMNITAIINGEFYDVTAPEPKRKTTIQKYLDGLNEIEQSYCILLIDGDTGEIVYNTSSSHAFPPCFIELTVRKAAVDYFGREIAIEI